MGRLDRPQLRRPGVPSRLVVWCVSVLRRAVVSLLFLLAIAWSLLLALVFDVAVLYLRRWAFASSATTDIRDALERGDEDRGTAAFWPNGATWMPANCRAPEVLRHVIEHARWRPIAMCSACSSGSCCCRPWASGRWAP